MNKYEKPLAEYIDFLLEEIMDDEGSIDKPGSGNEELGDGDDLGVL